MTSEPAKKEWKPQIISRASAEAAAEATLRAGGFYDLPPDPEVGDRMPDGTVYAGLSPRTKNPIYILPEDAPLKMVFEEAAQYAEMLGAHGRKDWRLPSCEELDVLFNNRAALPGLKDADMKTGCYWSSELNYEIGFGCAFGKSFGDGTWHTFSRNVALAARYVRG